MMKTIRIKKGVNLYVNERDKFNTAIFQVDFVFPADSSFFAHLNLLSDLIKKHSTRFQLHQDVIDFLEDHYGATLDVDYETFGTSTSFSLMVDFVHPRLLNDESYCFSDMVSFIEELIFNQNDRIESLFENEKKYCKNILKDELTSPETLAFYQALPHYISSDNLKRPLSGTFTQLNNVELDQVYDLWQNILQTSFVNIYYDGFTLSADDQKAINQFAQRFFPRDGFNQINPYYVENYKKTDQINEKHHTFRQNIFLQQYYLDGNAKYRNENYAAWLIFNQIFGGDSESFLFQTIREKLNLSYEAFSNISFGLNCFYVYATLNEKKFEQVNQEIDKIFDKIKYQKYSLSMLEMAKKSIENLLLYQNDGRFFDISQQKMKFLTKDYISNEDLIHQIKNVEPNDLSKCVNFVQPGIKMWYEGMQ
ncbi:M16 family metallopeptidase [Xylocopilactobacillus apis]|uniref:Peptidase M16 C-terminal domain-containing protein n=1 Tax=Xylocopilactobacillus apis TaxID=2932183 RepID=A0AAU9DP23_9LACO|nr:insulinase family protein [Xylocopilactobacillus apis]BDR56738.1 hypothetical protein KIMC2_13000 [Xylocopilactobacillus apis]